MRPVQLFDRLAAKALGPSEADLAHNLELAVSAHRFSRRTTAVVDDKLSFSAALMRAGEVDAAQRLLAEVEEEVMIEEAALIEVVNEVKVARSMSREHISRGRLARTLAVAMLGSSLLAFSAAGMAVVGLFKGNDQAIHGSDGRARTREIRGDVDASGNERSFKIAGISVSMTAAQQKRYRELADDGFVNEDGLERFLLELLPTPLADKIHLALVTGMDHLPAPVRDELKLAVAVADEKHREISQSQGGPSEKREASDEPTEQPAAEPSEEPAEEPADEPDPDESPGEEPSPSPTPEEGTPDVPLVGDN